jgi:hypothetical protein
MSSFVGRRVRRSLSLRRLIAGALVFGLAAGSWAGPLASTAAAAGPAANTILAWGDQR